MSASTRRPDIFVSATSGDLGHIRELAKQALLSIDCHPVEQTNFPPDYRSVEEMLRAKISACDAVLHIVGIRYGAEPDPETLPEGAERQSYTQMEARLARELGKKLYLFLCPDDFPYGDFPAEPEEKQSLQRAYRVRVRHDRQLRTTITSGADVELRVRELQTQIESLRHIVSTLEDTVTFTRRGHSRLFALGLFGMVILVGLGALVFHLTRKSDQQSTDTKRIERKLDQTLSSFSRERELLTKILDTSLRKNAEFENLTSEQRFDLALRQIALEEKIPAEQLQSTLEIYAAKVKALGDQADALDRVLVAQKDRQYEQAVRIADQGIATLEKQDDELAKTEGDLRKVVDQVKEERESNLLKRYDLLMAKGRSLQAQYLSRKASETYRQAEELLEPATHPALWSFARSSQIDSLCEVGIRMVPEEGNPMLTQAADLARDFLRTFPKDSHPKSWALAQNNLGNALHNLGTRLPGNDSIDSLNAARDAFEQALSIYTKEQLPQDWAMIQNNLGNVLWDLSKRLPSNEGSDSLASAKEFYEKALSIRTKDRLPWDWAATQNNLAVVLSELGERLPGQDGIDLLNSARDISGQALSIHTKDRFPRDWAMTYNNLGNILGELGRRLPGKEGIDSLASAKAAYEKALSVRTKDQFPQEWAMTQNNLGIVLWDLGARLPGEEGIEFLIASKDVCQQVVSIFTKDQLPQQWATIQRNRGNVLQSLGKRLPGKEGVEFLVAARDSYDQVLSIHTKDQFPHDWAATQNNLGVVLGEIGRGLPGERGTAFLFASRKALEESLSIRTKDQFPQDWATTQNNLGSVFRELGTRLPRTDGNDFFEEARMAYEQALSVLTQNDLKASKAGKSYLILLTKDYALAEQWAREGLQSTQALNASLNLAHALLFQGKYDEAIAIYQKHWNTPEDIGTGMTFREACIADLKGISEKGLTHPDLPKLKATLGISE